MAENTTGRTAGSLHDRLGAPLIREVISRFYERAFADPMIRHFFIRSDLPHVIEMQTAFASAMLGGPAAYEGLTLKDAHLPFSVRTPHFGRRQVLMREVLDECGVDPELRDAWLALEERLKPLIVNLSE